MSKPTTPAQRDMRERRRRVRSDLTWQIVTRIRLANDGYKIVQFDPGAGTILVRHSHDGMWNVRIGVTRAEVTR